MTCTGTPPDFPELAESRMFNAIVVTPVEHGITPSSLAAQQT
jgi:hypothetical protein